MLKALTKNSETLQDITDQFVPLVKQFHIFFFWESFQTERVTGKGYVVCEDFAAPIWDNTERSGIHATQRSIEVSEQSILMLITLTSHSSAKALHFVKGLQTQDCATSMSTYRTTSAVFSQAEVL